MRPITEIIAEIESYETDDAHWLRLDELTTELWESGNPELGIDAFFRIFEKYPTETGEGVFWTIMHGLETLDYETNLYNSLINKPSHMAITMLKRIENSNCQVINGKSIAELKKLIRNNSRTESELLDEL